MLMLILNINIVNSIFSIIFPEIDYDKIDKIKGMNVTFVTTASSDEEGRSLLRHLGMPFRK